MAVNKAQLMQFGNKTEMQNYILCHKKMRDTKMFNSKEE